MKFKIFSIMSHFYNLYFINIGIISLGLRKHHTHIYHLHLVHTEPGMKHNQVLYFKYCESLVNFLILIK